MSSSSSSSVAHSRVSHILGHMSTSLTSSSSISQFVHTRPCSNASTKKSTDDIPQLGSIKREFTLQEVRGRVGIIRLNRPSALNALSQSLMSDLSSAVNEFEHSGVIGCIIITGEGKAFAAGADIKQMQSKKFSDVRANDMISNWDAIARCRIPIIAAVNGMALGGGAELSMCCDIILASDAALFGQPEIKIGTIPGAGGTQRLTKAVGKSLAMEMVLTGNTYTAKEMVDAGLVSHAYPIAELMPHALAMAEMIASRSLPIIKLAKQSVVASFESTLSTGMTIERTHFQSTFALEDQKIGMTAFINKKKPEWQHQ